MLDFIKYVHLFILFLIILFILLIISLRKLFTFKDLKQEESIELILQRSDFDNIVKENNFVTSVFYINSCNHCHKFLQDFDKVSKDSSFKKWKFLKISCSEYPLICESMSISSFPTIKTYKNSKEIKISPPRELNSFIKFLKKVSDDPLIYNITKKEEFYEKYGTVSPLIEYKKDGKFLLCINNISQNEFLTDFYFGLIEIKEGKSFLSRNNNEKEKIIFNSTYAFTWNENCNEVKKFLYNIIYPLTNNIDLNFMKEMYRKKKKLFILFYDSNNNEINELINDSFKNISREYIINDIVFAYIDVKENKNKNILEIFEINNLEESKMQIGIYDFLEEKKFIQPLNDINNKKSIEDKIKKMLKDINSLEYINDRKPTMFLRNLHLKWTTKIFVVILSFAILYLAIFYDYPKDKDKTQ